MNEVIVKNVRLGTGLPKICVPVIGKTKEEILSQTKKAADRRPDLIEWRADFYQDGEDREKLAWVAEEMGAILGQIPMIFTIRTQEEGGEKKYSTEDYVKYLQWAAKLPETDIIDVEVMKPSLEGGKVVRMIQEQGKKVIASNHYFTRTPDEEAMLHIFSCMETMHADIRKLAVMPKDVSDVFRLMEVTEKALQQGQQPVVSMSMGELGKITRIAGKLTGSCITFAAVENSSAPGQLGIDEVRTIMSKI